MPTFSSFGIFDGGLITVENSTTFRISPFSVYTYSGKFTGNGGENNKAKSIIVSFGNSSDSIIYQRSVNIAPQLYLLIGTSTSNVCWIIYDEAIDDIALQLGSTPPATNTIIFGRLEWTNVTTINQITINYSHRTESYSASSSTVLSPSNLYFDGQRWIAGSKNKPLANISMFNTILKAATDRLFGSTYFLHDGNNDTVTSKDLKVILKRVKGYANLGNNSFSIYDTRRNESLSTGTATVTTTTQITSTGADFDIKVKNGNLIKISHSSLLGSVNVTVTGVTTNSITFTPSLSSTLVGQTVNYSFVDVDLSLEHVFPSIVSIQNQIIYVIINKTTGVPQIKTTYNSSTEHLVAYTNVPGTATNLNGLDWIIVNDFGGIYTLLNNQTKYLSKLFPSGFLQPLAIEELNTDNSFLIKKNILNISGTLLYIPDTIITLSAAPTTGSRQDFVYLEIIKRLNPLPNLSYEFKIKNNVDLSVRVDPFTDNILNSNGNSYSLAVNGLYQAADYLNEDDGVSYAIPIAIIHRFNTTMFSISSNLNGGLPTSRLDDKRHDRINLEEIEILGPTYIKPEYLNKLLIKNINKLLKGQLNNRLMPSYLDSTVYSRSPLQIDRIGTTTTITGTHHIGSPDGIRTMWSSDYSKEVLMYGWFKEDLDTSSTPYNFPSLTYNDATKVLNIQIPVGSEGEIILDNQGQPYVEAKWISTGNPVKFIGDWLVDDVKVASNAIDVLDTNYISGGIIAVTFKIKYTEGTRQGLRAIPSKYIGAYLNSPTGSLVNSFAISVDNQQSRFVKEMTRTTNINTVNYKDKLYISPVGAHNKFYTYEYHYYAPGNGDNSNDYIIDDSIIDNGIYSFVGLIEVRNAITGEKYPIDKVKWTYNTTSKYQIKLGGPISPSVTTPLIFVFGCGGEADKQIDINEGNLGITTISKVNIASFLGSSIATATQPNANVGIYRFSNGSLIYGVSHIGVKAVAWVGEDMVQCTYTNIGSNLISVDLSQTNITPYTTSNWVLSGGKYIPNNGVTIRIVMLQPFKLFADNIYITYKYNSLPFRPYMPNSGRFVNDQTSVSNLTNLYSNEPEIIDLGYILLSNDGVCNDRASYASPLTERFPEVDSINLVGLDSIPAPLGLNPSLTYQQLNSFLIEGENIKLDGTYWFNIQVIGGSGIANFICLIKQGAFIRMFLYTIREGNMILNKPNNAFICDLDNNYRVAYE